MRKRNHPINFRLTEEEYKLLSAKKDASGQTLQTFIINASLYGRIPSAEEISEMQKKNKLLEDIDKQLRGMGTNLNQMAHVANGQGMIPTAEELVRISNEVHQIKSEVKEEWQSTRRSISQLNPTGH